MSLGGPMDIEYLKQWWAHAKEEFPHYCIWREIKDINLENPEAQKQILKGKKMYRCNDMYCRKELWSKTTPSPFDYTEIYSSLMRTLSKAQQHKLLQIDPLDIQDEEQQRPEQED